MIDQSGGITFRRHVLVLLLPNHFEHSPCLPKRKPPFPECVRHAHSILQFRLNQYNSEMIVGTLNYESPITCTRNGSYGPRTIWVICVLVFAAAVATVLRRNVNTASSSTRAEVQAWIDQLPPRAGISQVRATFSKRGIAFVKDLPADKFGPRFIIGIVDKNNYIIEVGIQLDTNGCMTGSVIKACSRGP